MDLNRNYAIDFGVGEKTQVGLTEKNMYDPCADECGECYRGPAPFSEPESRAMRDFLISHKSEIKFVSNFHSFGNMWIYPFNGKSDNPIEATNPTAFAVLEEIANDAPFPEGN